MSPNSVTIALVVYAIKAFIQTDMTMINNIDFVRSTTSLRTVYDHRYNYYFVKSLDCIRKYIFSSICSVCSV